jgi:glycosyltransferase involved in cell wall biosynthesis
MSDSVDNSAPTVSITSAFYNTGPILLEMIESIKAQTFEDWELVLVDDGSTDGSLELARSVVDDRIRVVTNGRNMGQSASLNRLCRLARGRFIARMDSDDMCAPTRIEKQVAYLNDNATIDVVGTAVVYIDRDNQPLGWRAVPPNHDEICRHPSRMVHLIHGSILARREWFERFPYDESLRISVDSNLFFRTHSLSTFANIIEPLYYYRFEPSFTLRKQWRSRRVNAKYLFDEHRRAGHISRAAVHWGIQHAKFAVTALAFGTGLRRKLMARRFQPLSEGQKRRYRDELDRIMERRRCVAEPRSA